MANGLFQDVYRQMLQQQQQQTTNYGSGWDAITKAHTEIAAGLGRSLDAAPAKEGISENQKRANQLYSSLKASKDINALTEGAQELQEMGANKAATIISKRISNLKAAQKRIKPRSKNIAAIEKTLETFDLGAELTDTAIRDASLFMKEAQEAGIPAAKIEEIMLESFVDEEEKYQNVLERFGPSWLNAPEKTFNINKARGLSADYYSVRSLPTTDTSTVVKDKREIGKTPF